MSVKMKVVILALMTAIVVGLLLLDLRPNTKQVTNDTGQPSQQEHVHILQDKSADEVKPETQQPNPEPKSAQSEKREDVIEGNVLVKITQFAGYLDSVEFEAIINNQSETIVITLDNILIKARTDHQNITTIDVPINEIRSTGNFQFLSTGTILVPNQEDAEAWQGWLNKLKQQRKEFLAEQEARKKGRRILPPTD